MKFAIISDIHANYEALRAVLEVIHGLRIEHIYCAGDIVGYGPDPGRCIDLVRECGIVCVQGNHDEAVAQGHPREQMLPEAESAVYWTHAQLDADQVQWLAGLPHRVETDFFQVVHASAAPNPPWLYVVDEESALLNFLFQDVPLVFNGHTHVPLQVRHASGRRPQLALLHSQLLPRRHRLLVGVGAVGQPRDGDPRAAFVVYDARSKFLQLRRVAYDFSRTQARILAAGLPEMLAKRLTIGR